MTALIITTYNRPEYLAQCFNTLLNVAYPPDTVIVINDDCSTDKTTRELINGFEIGGEWVRIIKNLNTKNKGIKGSLLDAYEIAWHLGADIAINLDSDAIVRPNFIMRLLELKKQFPKNVVSGFNSQNKDNGVLRNPIISEHEGYAIKLYANGINMCINKADYVNIKKALLSDGNWDFNSSKVKHNIIAVPSLVQHIGIVSSMGHGDPDVACDFKLLSLPDVTLFGIDAHDQAGIKRAAQICTTDVEFGATKIITERLFQGREGYSEFCIRHMNEHVNTSHVLIIHPDGFIQNPLAWSDSWLQYDYIGATWLFKDGMNNGNGGFSLRSKKLLDILSRTQIGVYHPEDDVICRQLRPWLEKEFGIKFAPDEVCNKFSIEAYGCSGMADMAGFKANTYTGQFGFHGYGVAGLPIQPATKAVTQPTSKYRR